MLTFAELFDCAVRRKLTQHSVREALDCNLIAHLIGVDDRRIYSFIENLNSLDCLLLKLHLYESAEIHFPKSFSQWVFFAKL